MTDPKDQAFPRDYTPGLTKREYFAAIAVQGMLANPELVKANELTSHVLLEHLAIQIADGLIQAFNGD